MSVITKGLIGQQDLSIGTGTFTRTTSTGGTNTLTQIPKGLASGFLNAVRFADQFSGSDPGAQINAADIDLGTNPGEIWVFRLFMSSINLTTAVTIHSGHTLRFIDGGYWNCTAGFTLEQGASIIGSGAWISTATTSTGTTLFHNFNGDFITYSGAATGTGTLGGGVLQNFSIYNTFAGGDLNGRAIVITGTALSLRTNDVVIDRVYVDGNSATNRWTNGLVVDGTPIGGTNGVRNITVMNSRFHSSGTNNQDILIKNAFNTVILNVKITNSNNGAQTPGITITGTAGNLSSGAQLVGINTTNLVLDWASAVDVEGGFYSSITNTANTGAGVAIRPASLTNAFTNNGSAATTAIYPDPVNSGRTITLGPITGVAVASGTATLTSNAALGATTPQAAVTVAAIGALTTDAIEWSYATAPSSDESLCIISAYVTSGNVNFVRSNPTAGNRNVTAIVINWRVIR